MYEGIKIYMAGGAAGVGGGVSGATGSAASSQSGGGGPSYSGNYSPSFGYGNTGFNQGQQSSITGQTAQNAQSAYGVNGYAPASAPVTNSQVQGAIASVPVYGALASQVYGMMNPNQQGIAFGVGGTNARSANTGPSSTPGGSGMNYQNKQNPIQGTNNAGINAMATDQAISDQLLSGSSPGALDMFTGEGKRSTLASQQQGINTQWGATNPELYTANSGKLASRLAEQNAGDIARNAEAQAANMALSNARTAGLNPAQAALLANQSGQNVYGQTFNSALAQGLHDYLNQYNTATNTRSGLLGVLGQNASQQNEGLTAQDWLNAAAGVAGVASNAWNNSQNPTVSDKNMKEKIKGNKTIMDIVSSRMGGKQFNYKGSETPVIGVMAQDMEKTPLKESVIDGDTKMVDTNNLSKQNIELLVSSLATIKGKLGKLKELIK